MLQTYDYTFIVHSHDTYQQNQAIVVTCQSLQHLNICFQYLKNKSSASELDL